MNLFDKLRAALGIKTELQKIYTANLLPGPVDGLAKYPPKDFVAEQGVYAYRIECMLADASSLVDCLRSYFPSVEKTAFQEGPHCASNGESTHFAIRPEFKGATVELLTNSVSLLRAIDALHLTPPPPWKVFPHIDASTLGSLQGDMDYWWWMYWGPFWDAASPSVRAEYLQLHKPNQAWAEYIQRCDSLGESDSSESPR